MDRFTIHHFDVLDSTQIEAKKELYPPGSAIIADSQTAGYGRRGRTWQAPVGNLMVTLVEQWNGIEQLSWIGYAIGLGLYDAIHPLLKDDVQLNVKWPNDLLIDLKKLSGILLEIEGDRLIIGIGVNIAIIPETDQPVTTVNQNSFVPHQPIDILKRFLTCYEHWVNLAQEGGFAALRSDWLARAAYIGHEITAKLADGTTLTGIFKDIDHTGALVLTSENRHDTIRTADIYLTKENYDSKINPR